MVDFLPLFYRKSRRGPSILLASRALSVSLLCGVVRDSHRYARDRVRFSNCY